MTMATERLISIEEYSSQPDQSFSELVQRELFHSTRPAPITVSFAAMSEGLSRNLQCVVNEASPASVPASSRNATPIRFVERKFPTTRGNACLAAFSPNVVTLKSRPTLSSRFARPATVGPSSSKRSRSISKPASQSSALLIARTRRFSSMRLRGRSDCFKAPILSHSPASCPAFKSAWVHSSSDPTCIIKIVRRPRIRTPADSILWTN